MRLLLTVSAILMSAFQANADEFRQGMRIQFLQDTFSDRISLAAYLPEASDSVMGGAQLQFYCSKGQPITAAIVPDMIFFMADVKADFKSPKELISVSFSPAVIEGSGKHVAASAEDSAKLIEMVSESSEISFRTEKKQGKFQPVAAKEAFGLLSAFCEK